MSERVYEDAIRFVRQRLLALEEGRDDDAKTIQEFIEKEFGLHTADVSIDDVSPSLLARWVSVYGLPALVTDSKKKQVRVVSVLREHANEPIFRIPGDRDKRGPGALETPLAILLPYVTAPWAEEDPWDMPKGLEHVAPREKGSDLPPKVAAAIRPWAPPTE